jgi:PIN domain nuclease of toxin-antitoxin system
MTALLDTHTLVWTAIGSAKLSPLAHATIRDSANRMLVSSASAWEIATKVRIGKFPEAVSVELDFLNIPSVTGFEFLELTVEAALLAGRLKGTHKDPFDRMLAAQAIVLGIPIISGDSEIDTFGVRRIW